MRSRLALLTWMVGLFALVTGTACRPRSAAAPNPTAVEAVNRGVSLMGQYDYDGAVRSFEEALAAAPGHREIRVNLSIARFNRGRKENDDLDQATALLDAVLREDPGHVRALYFKGIVLQHQGDAAAAIPCFERVLQARPDDGVAWYILGMCRQRVGQDPEKDLLRAIELHPYLVSAYYRLWQSFQAAGQTDRAAPFLEKFKQLRDHPLAETIELPQYNQMGDLALVIPLEASRATAPVEFTYRAGAARDLLVAPTRATTAAAVFGGAGFVDTDQDGHWEVLAVGMGAAEDAGAIHLRFVDGRPQPVPSALDGLGAPLGLAIGDYDNDERADVLVVLPDRIELLRGEPDGSFSRATGMLGNAATGPVRSALWLDADHDGDLDLLLCRTGAPLQLLNNNADGTFADITAAAGLAQAGDHTVLALPGDIDRDRDMDLVLLRVDAPAAIFLNELAGTFREVPVAGEIRGDLGGLLQDFNGDGHLDLLALADHPALPALHLGDGRGGFARSPAFAEVALAAAAFGTIRAVRATDLDLDGDLDVAVFGEEGHALLNSGTGSFTLQGRLWQPGARATMIGAELADVTGDLIPDAILLERGTEDRMRLIAGEITPEPTAIAVAPTGVRSRDKRTRSPASGYGVMTVLRHGLHEQSRWFTGQAGGLTQSPAPQVLGLAGAPRADYLRLHWPDGVAQIERDLAAGRLHSISETQRKVSSCPVLFTWNGERFEFITDFAGVGGLGYYLGGGEYGQPQPVDHVKIEPHQLQARDGRYDVRITEPMEETAYVDRIELVAIDHPATWLVFPDERLAITGPVPTRELLAIAEPIFPERALNPRGEDCAAALRGADRTYAFEPELDRRFIGFSRPHSLELDFGDQVAALARETRVFLFITGYLEYPYSQTTYAAGQAGLGWEPIRIERAQADGGWEVIVPDAGAFGGMSRTMTVDLSGLVAGGPCRLRLTTNLEIYYDRIFLGVPVRSERVTARTLPLVEAELGYHGIAREVSPDGRHPLVYTYEQPDLDVPFLTLSGDYTRYGGVRELLEADDDQFVLVGTGDEIAASFDATILPEPAPGTARSFVLMSHAYCKDMDLYTATPQTLEPMPFRGMSRYPYPEHERPPETEEQRRLRESYRTRRIE